MSLLEGITPLQRELLEKHLELVLDANKTMNLTRIDTFDEGVVKHVEDSLVALEEIESAPAGLYGDLGSGAGFPGIPISVVTGRKTLLIDARQKKMMAMKKIIENLGLQDQIDVYSGRAELLARSKPKSFSVLTARALAKLSVLMELASPLLPKGGRLVCYKANVDADEFEHAIDVQKKTGMSLLSDRDIVLSDGETYRRIIVFEKKNEPTVKLPRQEGAAQKKPL